MFPGPAFFAFMWFSEGLGKNLVRWNIGEVRWNIG